VSSSYQVLARKWRPMRFADVKGQDHIVKTLRNAILSKRIAHSFLFSGSRGVGKTSVARILAKALCCLDPQDAEPCNKCVNCLEITNSSSIDIQEIDGASNNGVDAVREIRDNIIYPPVSAPYRIYIIDEVHMLSNSAFNALLKTLEEPPPHGIFIFATTEAHKIPQTIVSRCQRFDFRKLGVEDIYNTLNLIAKSENMNIVSQAMYLIAKEARGSVRDSLSILDQVVSFSGNDTSFEDVKSILGFVDRSIVYGIVKGITGNNPRDCVSLCRKIYSDAYDEKRIADSLIEVFRNMLFVKLNMGDMLVAELPDYEIKELKDVVKDISASDIEQWFYMANTLADDISRSINPYIMLEVGVLSMCNKPQSVLLQNLISDISGSEQKKNTNAVTVVPSPVISGPKGAGTLELSRLVGILNNRKPELAELLQRSNFLGIENETSVVFDYSNRPLDIQKFSENEKYLDEIQSTIYELTGKLYKIDIRDNLIMQRVGNNITSEKKKKEKLLDKDIVKEAIKIFNARVIEVKTE
jgi:DNA polymerase III subunit gamma/tau